MRALRHARYLVMTAPGGRDCLERSRFRIEVVVRRRSDVPRPFLLRSAARLLLRRLLSLFFRRVFGEDFLGILIEVVAAAGAADVVGLAVVGDFDGPQAAGGD